MREHFRILAMAVFMLAAGSLCSQHDSLYLKLYKLSSKRKFTELMYRLVFVEPQAREYPLHPEQSQGQIINPYISSAGKRIRSIIIQVSDPFAHTDSSAASGVERIGNVSHLTTRKWIISNKLLFREGDTLVPLQLSESERLLRQASFASDAQIRVTELDSANVAVYVLVHDKWSVTAPLEVTAHNANILLRDDNFFGLGQQFEQYAGYTSAGYRYYGSYLLNNIDNTYISAKALYNTTNTGTTAGLVFDRPFFSPLTRWAGGVAFTHSQQFYTVSPADGVNQQLNATNGGADLWAGRSFKIMRDGQWMQQSHNLVLTGRYFTNHYFRRPQAVRELLGPENNTSAFIGGLGFSLQQYYKDRFIYRFGANEDVPTGVIAQLLYGVQKKEFVLPRWYFGVEFGRAAHRPAGYVSVSAAMGIYFNRSYTNDVSASLRCYYISNLLRAGRWYLRQFVNYSLVTGLDKFYQEKLSLTGADLYGFNGSGLRGETKMVMDLETVAYAPYKLIGFRFAPVLMAGYGMIDGAGYGILQSNLYQAYSLGIMFRNENLLNSTFQVSFGLYPFFPDGQNYVWRYNPVTSFTVRVRAFGITRPDFIAY